MATRIMQPTIRFEIDAEDAEAYEHGDPWIWGRPFYDPKRRVDFITYVPEHLTWSESRPFPDLTRGVLEAYGSEPADFIFVLGGISRVAVPSPFVKGRVIIPTDGPTIVLRLQFEGAEYNSERRELMVAGTGERVLTRPEKYDII